MWPRSYRWLRRRSNTNLHVLEGDQGWYQEEAYDDTPPEKHAPVRIMTNQEKVGHPPEAKDNRHLQYH
jgi:hypothetical protein